MIGKKFYFGLGIPQDYEKAFEWYVKAAGKGYSNAENSLGNMYRYGFGVEKEYKKALEWYKKAAYKGHSTARSNMSKVEPWRK